MSCKTETPDLSVRKVTIPEGTELSAVPALMDRLGVAFTDIASDNWGFSAEGGPQVGFRMVHTGSAILLHFRVSEDELRAVETADNGHPWQDSCCEFFFSPRRDTTYYNLECSCIGKILFHEGIKGDRVNAPAEAYAAIGRWSSLGDEAFDSRTGEFSWDLVERIPVAALFADDIKDFSGLTFGANLYKCGDGLSRRHYLSWQPIDLPSPQFHAPAFFGTIRFEK